MAATAATRLRDRAGAIVCREALLGEGREPWRNGCRSAQTKMT